MEMVPMRKAGMTLALLAVGFAAGNVLADTGVNSFKKATLFKAMKRIHRAAGADVIWTGEASAARSFDLAAGGKEETVRAAAKQFGRHTIPMGGVFVLEPALPEFDGAEARVDALDDYLKQALPTVPTGPGIPDFVEPLSGAMTANAKIAHAGIGSRTVDFSQLPPGQQQSALDALRAAQIYSVFLVLQDLSRAR